MKKILTCALLCSSLTTFAQQDCSELFSTHEIKQCLNTQLEQADKQLNLYYRQLKQYLEPKRFKLLRNTQLAWIKLRDTQCDFEASEMAGGTFEQVLYLSCQKRFTEQRVQDFKRELGITLLSPPQCNTELSVGNFEMRTCILDKQLVKTSNLPKENYSYMLTNDTIASRWDKNNSLTLTIVKPFAPKQSYIYKNYDIEVISTVLAQHGIDPHLAIRSSVSNANCGTAACLELNFSAEHPRQDLYYQGAVKFIVKFDARSKEFSTVIYSSHIE